MKKIIENKENRNNNYLFPFFWQHGESNEKIKEYIDKMLEQGIYNMCVESRPHPDFLEQGWWNSLDFIIEQAKINNMKMWILDDAKFPTGYANGKVPEHLKKKYLACKRYDFVGPIKQAKINASMPAGMREAMKDKRHAKDTFYKAILVENSFTSPSAFEEDTLIDVSEYYTDGFITLDLEDKHYSLFVLYRTMCGGEEATKEYLDPMNKEATQILIDEVYQKHYDHYHEEFGKTIVGFFSDEPRFGNMKGTTASIGREDMPLPWNEEVEAKLDCKELIFLFTGNSTKANQMRYRYMDTVSQLYSDNFCCHIGDWCKNKGVDYVGHTIEDNNAHARLGYGAGHYFRGIAGQTIAGIDIIGGQVVPGMDYHHDAFSTGGSDGEFYHYALAKLGASSAKLDKNKKGILMCEAFGAYGWVEGLKMMKWITDHMLSHGVNLIVPHAFDPKEFPDWDCPPHFYAHGNNPQYPYFHKWSKYADRLCNLMSDGYHEAKVGVLYHGFAEWSGDYMYIQKVLKVLQQNQISNDIISEDYLLEAKLTDTTYQINGYDYEVLVIPYAKRLPKVLLECIEEVSKHCKVICLDAYPEDIQDNTINLATLSTVASLLESYKDIKTTTKEKYLVCYPYIHQDGRVYMLSNEDIIHTITTTVTVERISNLAIYDAYTNTTHALEYRNTSGGIEFEIVLEPYQSIILFEGKENIPQVKKSEVYCQIEKAKVSKKEYFEKEFTFVKECCLDEDLGLLLPKFSGQLKYECTIDATNTNLLLSLKEAYEIIEVKVNAQSVDCLITPPFNFDLSKHIQEGINTIEIIATNNLSRSLRDPFSMYLLLEPLGIRKPITIYTIEQMAK